MKSKCIWLEQQIVGMYQKQIVPINGVIIIEVVVVLGVQLVRLSFGR